MNIPTGGAPSRASYIRARVATLGPGESVAFSPDELGIRPSGKTYRIDRAQVAVHLALLDRRGEFVTARGNGQVTFTWMEA